MDINNPIGIRVLRFQTPKFGLEDSKGRLVYPLFLVTCILCLVVSADILEAQLDDGMVDIKDAIAIVSAAMGVKIVVEGDVKGRIPLEMDNLTPRQIRDRLERALNASGFSWVSEGGIVRITRSGQRIWRSALSGKLPLSYYIDVFNRNNLFRPLGIESKSTKSEFVLTGTFGVGENRRAIIEDTAKHKSYYISKGESIGNFKVAEISEERVILTGPSGSVILKIQKEATG